MTPCGMERPTGGLHRRALRAHEVSEHHPAIRVLLTTGYSEMAAAAETRYRILRKPFEVSGLERAVRDAMTAPSGPAGRRAAGGAAS